MTSRKILEALVETLIRTPALHVKVAVGDYPLRDSSNSVRSVRHGIGEAVADQLENTVEDLVSETIYERFGG